MLGHYRIVRERGDDNLGRVYVAEQHGIRSVSKTVALRCIHPALARSLHFKETFSEAARIAPRLEHPNVLTIFEMGELNGIYFISTEDVPGETLLSLLTRRNARESVPPDIAAYVVKHAATAVQYLHGTGTGTGAARHVGIAHGALDPSNILVTVNGTVKLLSVGLPARAGDPRRDVFELGVILWTCLTGEHFPHDPADVDAAGPHRHWVAPSSVRADVPHTLDAIAMQALSADPLDRFQNVHALSVALDHYLVQRNSRLTPRHLRRWLDPAPSNPRPRQLWSTSHGAFSRLSRGSIVPPRVSEPGSGSASLERLSVSAIHPRQTFSGFTGPLSPPTAALASLEAPRVRQPPTWMVGAMLAFCAVIALGITVILSSSGEGSPSSDAARGSPSAHHGGRVEVRSTPEGAAVFVDGEPTGLRTPVSLKGLADGRSLRLRVEKAGFVGQEREVTIGSGEAHTFELLASDGLVHFVDVPAGASIFIDDVEITLGGRPLELPVGRHRVRVETLGSLFFSDTVVIVAGEQTIRVHGAEAAP